MSLILNLDPKIYVVIGIVTTAVAQIVLKRAGGIKYFKAESLILLGLSVAFYVLSFVSYYFALRKFDISTVQPIMMVSIVGLITLYGALSGESFSFFKVAGIVVACLSIFLISKG